jgi:hypothetical protein
VEVNSILSPVVAVSDQLETLASQRMVWLRRPAGSRADMALKTRLKELLGDVA